MNAPSRRSAVASIGAVASSRDYDVFRDDTMAAYGAPLAAARAAAHLRRPELRCGTLMLAAGKWLHTARRACVPSDHARPKQSYEEGVSVEMATTTKRWTLEEVHSLPDDGNKYELVHGDLYVTPPPGWRHDTIVARLTRILDPYVAANGLGFVYHPRSVFRIGKKVEVEPDLMVRRDHPDPKGIDEDWETAPRPILVVEIISPTTRRREFGVKREVYIDEARLPEYWIVDGDTRVIHVLRPGHATITADSRLEWRPTGVETPLVIDLDQAFGPPYR